ncbi:hypothetical protein BC834DRAFT_973793 [Gloeopeniophorella convolvens]|nr:hypothetical protein BC834DRAFT_973793 [Gloeopeniophorella convolvens]
MSTGSTDTLTGRAVGDFLVLYKLLHVVVGLEIWYYVANIRFDWEIASGRRPLRWPGAIYLAMRLSSVGCVVTILVGLSARHVDCRIWAVFVVFFPYVELDLALFLTALRVIAISEQYRPLVAASLAAWLIHIGTSIHFLTQVGLRFQGGSMYQVHGVRVDIGSLSSCTMFASQPQLLIVSIVTLATYFALLATTICALLLQPVNSTFGVWRLLYNQGLVWFALAALTEIPTLVLLCINLSTPFNMMLQIPRVVIVSIGTTTMFRTLQNYRTNERKKEQIVATDPVPHASPQGDRSRSSTPVLPFQHVEVAITTTFDQYSDECISTLRREKSPVSPVPSCGTLKGRDT